LRGAEGDAAIQSTAGLLRYARNGAPTAGGAATATAISPGTRRR
jgi:hypothetical protein